MNRFWCGNYGTGNMVVSGVWSAVSAHIVRRYAGLLLLSMAALCSVAWSTAVSAAPTFQAAGAAASGTGAVSPAWPAHAVNDVALLFVESAGGQAATLSTPAGFVAVTNSPQATGLLTLGTRLSVFWARATSAAMTAPTVADPGNHVHARIVTYRNVITAGNPWDVTGGGVKAIASTAVSVTGVTTTVADTLIVQAVARDNDSTAAAFSAQTNASLTGIAERADAGTTSGNGGGIAVWDGVKATAGATGNTTATVTSSINAFLTIALKPQPPSVLSIVRANPDPSTAASVSWTVTFSQSVTGVSSSNFALVNVGLGGSPAITSVTGSGTTWTVTASTGSGTGTLGLNMDNVTGISPAITTAMPFVGEVYSVRPVAPVVYYHDTTNGVNIGFDGMTNVTSGTNQTIPPIITALLTTATTCTGNARSANHPTGLYTHSRWYLPSDYTLDTRIGANPAGRAFLRGQATSDSVIVRLYDYDPVTGGKTLIGSSATITLTGGGTTTAYPYTISSAAYVVPVGHRLMLQYDFNQPATSDRARVYCSSADSYISLTEIPVAPDHIEIQHGSGTGITCLPNTLTIKACADNAIPCAPYTAGLTGTLSATGAGMTVIWDGTTGGAAGAGFVIPSGSSSVTKNVQVTTMGDVVFDAVSTPAASALATCNFGAPACTFSTEDAGFLVSAPDHVAESDSALTIQAVKKSDTSASCVPALTGNKIVHLSCAYSIPATGTLPVRVGGFALNASGDVNAACDGTGRDLTLSFDANGIATHLLNYADVGVMLITASYVDVSLTMNGTGDFVAVPASFAFSALTAGPIKSGDAFSATISALNSIGNITPNFGKEGDGVTLASTLVAPNPVTFPAAGNPVPGNNVIAGTEFGAGGMVGSDADGVATVNNLSWGEVGSITLTATLTSGNYLGSGIDATGTSATVGAFIPHHFDTEVVATATAPMTCPTGLSCPTSYNGFVYSGQPFSVQVTAKNLVLGTTANYDGTFGLSRAVTLSAWDALGSTTTPNPGGGVLANNAVAAADFTAGVATTVAPTYAFPASETAPTNIFLRAVDTDGASSLSAVPADSVEGGVKVASGRIKLSNAHGSELLPLPLTATVQYYNGNAWVRSDTDTLTTLNASDFALAFPAGTVSKPNNLAACETAVSIAGASPAFTVNLSKPGSGNNGWTNLTLNLGAVAAGNRCTAVGGAGAASTTANRPWLQFPAGANPTARATFGVYKGNNEFIYLRENY